MIVSSITTAWRDGEVVQHRANLTGLVVRHVRLRGLVDDERLLAPTLGRGTDAARARAQVALAGRSAAIVDGEPREIAPGSAILVAPLERLASVTIAGETSTVEIDWDVPPGASFDERVALGPKELAATIDVAMCLARARTEPMPFAAAARALLGRLVARALPFDVPPSAAFALDADGQASMDAFERALACMSARPQLVDLEARAGGSRWTLTRRVHALYERYGLCGVGGSTDWRSVRDFRRLRLARILMTHARATTREIASSVGYASPDAMCHAFARAGLGSPGSARAASLTIG